MIPYYDKFHHFAVAWDGKDVIFYIDGKEISKHDAGKGPGIETDFPVLLGNSPSGSTFEGVLDEIGIFNRALSPKEIKSMMNDGFEKFSPVPLERSLSTTWGYIKVNRFHQ